MAVLSAKRIHHEEIIEVAAAALPLLACKQKLDEIAQFPNARRANNQKPQNTHGMLWIEIELDNGDLYGDPIEFLSEHALETLIRTGMPEEMAKERLSDEYALQWLDRYYQRKTKLAITA